MKKYSILISCAVALLSLTACSMPFNFMKGSIGAGSDTEDVSSEEPKKDLFGGTVENNKKIEETTEATENIKESVKEAKESSSGIFNKKKTSGALIDSAEIIACYSDNTDGYMYKLSVSGKYAYWKATISYKTFTDGSWTSLSYSSSEALNDPYFTGGSVIDAVKAEITPYDAAGNGGEVFSTVWDPARTEKVDSFGGESNDYIPSESEPVGESPELRKNTVSSDTASKPVERDYQAELTSAFENYAKNLCTAINNGDYSYVASYIVPGSSLENDQRKLVSNLYSKNITETFDGGYITSIEWIDDYNCKIHVTETETIYSSQTQQKTFNWVYTANYDSVMGWRLSKIE
ncbi:MAG: hypothetical protein IJS61_03600 [Firmicutes bacterium]|nr:hypothetical protein [Bacillota bacterium]